MRIIKKNKFSLLVMATLLLSACATLSKQECQTADWQTIGYQDGKHGRDLDYILNHNKACGRINIVPNKTQWQQGREQGLKQYCTADNAFVLGKMGNRLNNVCPEMAQLQRYNEKGLTIYRLQQAIDSDTREREKLVEQYKKLRNGENLDLKTEKEARNYMSELPYKINALTNRINENTKALTRLGY